MSEPPTFKKLILIAGPTAVGKTEVTLKLAQHLQCPVLSSDARQCYHELGVATAKPTIEEQRLARHYFINTHSVYNPISAADYEVYALKVLQEVFDEGNYCIATGGSGLYIKALCEGLDEMPTIPTNVKLDLELRFKQNGLAPLLEELRKLDPKFFSQVDTSNHRRILRALEVCISTGLRYSDFRKGARKVRPFEIIKIALNRSRNELYRRIEDRMEQMISKGLFEEAAHYYDHRNLAPLKTVGYQEVFDNLDGKQDYEETVRILKRNSRRYAKRQLTWFRKDAQFHWLHPEDWDGILNCIK